MTTITVPDYIKEPADAALYIRKELIARGIDPDSVYPIDSDQGDTLVLTAPRVEPFMVEMSFTYDNKDKRYFEPNKKPVTMSYQQGFHSSGG